MNIQFKNLKNYPSTVESIKDAIGLNTLEKVISLTLPQDGRTELTRNFGATEEVNAWWLDQVQCVLLADDLTINEVIATRSNPDLSGADLTGASGQVMVRIPKIYYRETFNDEGVLIQIDIAPEKLVGYQCHPAFVRADDSERDYTFISRYEASDVGGKLSSISGVAPLTSVPISTFRSKAQARGSKWSSYGFWHNHLEMLLFLAYYADFNSQLKLPGYTNANAYDGSYKRLSGRTDALNAINGSVAVDLTVTDSDLIGIVSEGNAIANQFLFIENIFGHIWKLLDGCAADGRIGERNTIYATNNPLLFSSVEADVLANYENLAIDLPANADAEYIQNLQKGLLPLKFGGNSSTYITDYFYSYLDDETRDYLRVLLAGGALYSGGYAGVAARIAYVSLGYAYSDSGSRLCAGD